MTAFLGTPELFGHRQLNGTMLKRSTEQLIWGAMEVERNGRFCSIDGKLA